MTERFTTTLELPDSLLAAPELVTVHPGIAEVRHGEESVLQRIGYTLTEPIGPVRNNTLVVMPSQWSEYADRGPQRDRQASVVAPTSVPTLALDMPGQSPNSDQLTSEQRKALKQGDWTVLGTHLWEAAEVALAQHGIDIHDKEIVLFGMSQGGPISSGMAAVKPELVTVSDIVLWNSPSPFNIRKRDALALGYDMALFAGKDLSYYANLNPDWAYRETPADGKRILRHPYNHFYLAPKAIAASTDSAVLYDPIREGRLPDVRVHFFHASEDRVSAAINNEEAELLLRRVTSEVVRREQQGEYHSITNYMGAVAAVASDVLLLTH